MLPNRTAPIAATPATVNAMGEPWVAMIEEAASAQNAPPATAPMSTARPQSTSVFVIPSFRCRPVVCSPASDCRSSRGSAEFVALQRRVDPHRRRIRRRSERSEIARRQDRHGRCDEHRCDVRRIWKLHQTMLWYNTIEAGYHGRIADVLAEEQSDHWSRGVVGETRPGLHQGCRRTATVAVDLQCRERRDVVAPD